MKLFALFVGTLQHATGYMEQKWFVIPVESSSDDQ